MIRDAWAELDTCRPRGMAGEGPIPWTAVEEYAEKEGWVDRRRFHVLIRQMDQQFLRRRADAAEARLKSKETR